MPVSLLTAIVQPIQVGELIAADRGKEMTGLSELPLSFRTKAYSQKGKLAALYGISSLAIVASGVLGLYGGRWLGLWSHPLFASLLCAWVFAHWRRCLGHSPGMRPIDIRQMSRRLSLMVYIYLYMVIGVGQVASIVHSLFLGSVVDFNIFDARFHHGPDTGEFSLKDDLQLFFASGLLVLVFVRILAFASWVQLGKHGAIEKGVGMILDHENHRLQWPGTRCLVEFERKPSCRHRTRA